MPDYLTIILLVGVWVVVFKVVLPWLGVEG